MFPLLSSWLTAIWESLFKLCSSQSTPYLWHSLDVQGAFWDTGNDSAIGTKLQKSCCLSQMNWDPEQKLCEPKEFQVKARWTFYLLIYIWSSFMKLTSVSISNSGKFFILTLRNEHLLFSQPWKISNTWLRWILSWVLAHCKIQKHNEFSILKDSKALWPKLFM